MKLYSLLSQRAVSYTHLDVYKRQNRESGDGFSDILIEPEDPDAGIVIEVKYTKEMKELDAACEAAMAQIKNCLLYTSRCV